MPAASGAPGGHGGDGHHASRGSQGPARGRTGLSGPERAQRPTAHLGDAGIRALAVGARQLQPVALVDGAVLPEGTLALALAPAAFEVRVRLEAQPAALTHGAALIEVNCGQRARGAWRWGRGLGGARDCGAGGQGRPG